VKKEKKQMKRPIPYSKGVEDIISMFSSKSENYRYSKRDILALLSLKIELFEKAFILLVSEGKSTEFYMLKLSANYNYPDSKFKQFEQIYSLKYHVDDDTPGSKQFETMIRNSTRERVYQGLLSIGKLSEA
jgi:hypothetical protein